MKPVSFYLVTDTHYFEPSLGASGTAYKEYMKREQYFMAESSEIVKKVFSDISADKETEIVLIPGDLSKNGETESHKGFIKELYKLKESGKKIFVITAGHDYNEYSRAFIGDDCIQVEGTEFKKLKELYYDFGYSEAIAVDEQSLSYIAEISDGLQLLAINCDGEGNPKGAVDERLTDWIKIQLDNAKISGATVIAMCHYPMIPPVPVFDLVGDAKLKQWRDVATLLADNGVKLILTGHMHIQSVNEFVTEKGNRIFDICTSCLVGSPAKYRKIKIDDEKINVKSIDVPDFGADMNGLSVSEFFDKQFKISIINRIKGILNGDGILKKAGRKILNGITVGGIGRLLFIKVDKSIKSKKFIDLAGDIGLAIFKGDTPYTEGSPVYNAFSKALKRLGFILKKVEPKLSKNGVKVDLYDMLMNTLHNNKKYSDNDTEINMG